MNIFEKFGLREVANVHLEALSADDRLDVAKGDIVLYLDTLKLANIEGTAENVEARGGRGNPALISWDYGREVTMTLQDALFSVESLAVTTGAAKKITDGNSANKVVVRQTKSFANATELGAWTPKTYPYKWIQNDGTRGIATASGIGEPSAAVPVRVFFDTEVETANKAIEVSINSEYFGGTYKLYGDTLIRDVDGKDHPYQVVIPKAKISSNFTFEMSPDGDPSVLDIDVRVLRDDNGDMVKLIRYDLTT